MCAASPNRLLSLEYFCVIGFEINRFINNVLHSRMNLVSNGLKFLEELFRPWIKANKKLVLPMLCEKAKMLRLKSPLLMLS